MQENVDFVIIVGIADPMRLCGVICSILEMSSTAAAKAPAKAYVKPSLEVEKRKMMQ